MTTYFTDASFKFLRGLARHNDREWFHAHKADYEAHVRGPFQRLLTDLQPALANVSEHYRADPKAVGGSLFRIQRDTRFANDKSPYKSWQGARLFHARGRQVEAPSFYLHLQPGECFIATGIWHPQPDTLRRVRQFILDNPGSWKAAAHAASFRRRYDLDDSEVLTRTPRGFPDEFEFAADLRRVPRHRRCDHDRTAPAQGHRSRYHRTRSVHRLPVRRARPGVLKRSSRHGSGKECDPLRLEVAIRRPSRFVT